MTAHPNGVMNDLLASQMLGGARIARRPAAHALRAAYS